MCTTEDDFCSKQIVPNLHICTTHFHPPDYTYFHLFLQSDIRAWQKVMWLLGAWYLLGGLVYAIFGTVELQPWARPKDSGDANEEVKSRTKYGTTDSRNAFAVTNYFEDDDRP